MVLHTVRRGAVGTAGFTMVEIALCLGVIAIALVAIIGVMPTGLQVQKNNREDTIINQDGRFFMEAIRTGARGSDHLTNFVLSITYSNSLGDRIVHTNSPGRNLPSGYRNSVTNGQAIVGLLSTPRYFGTTSGRGTGIGRLRHMQDQRYTTFLAWLEEHDRLVGRNPGQGHTLHHDADLVLGCALILDDDRELLSPTRGHR